MRPEEKKRLKATAVKLTRASTAALFGMSALLKLTGFSAFIYIFSVVFKEPSLRYVIGFAELAGAILVVLPHRALAGGLILFGVSVFAIAHVVMMGERPYPLLIGTALAVAVIAIEVRGRGVKLREQRGKNT